MSPEARVGWYTEGLFHTLARQWTGVQYSRPAGGVVYGSKLVVHDSYTIDTVGFSTTSVLASTQVRLAIYNVDPTTGYPTGPPLAEVLTTVAASGATVWHQVAFGPLTLPVGVYAVLSNSDGYSNIAGMAYPTFVTGAGGVGPRQDRQFQSASSPFAAWSTWSTAAPTIPPGVVWSPDAPGPLFWWHRP